MQRTIDICSVIVNMLTSAMYTSEHGGGDYRFVIRRVNDNFLIFERLGFDSSQYSDSGGKLAWESPLKLEILICGTGWPTGLEPATTRTTIWGSTIELRPPSLTRE